MAVKTAPPAATPAARVTRQQPAAGHAGRKRGTGASTAITVKGRRADAEQRTVIDQALTEAHDLGGSRRLLIAVVMCMTQESSCRRLGHGDAAGPDSRGPFQQRKPWGPERDRLDPAKSCHMFCLGGKGGQPGWKQIFGSLKNTPGSLDADIRRVQVSVGGYAQWENEATNTVDAWLGGRIIGDRTIVEPYEFTRGERHGHREDSWACSGRLAEEVNWSRWAELNTLFFASDDELRAAAPSLEVHGDEPWLLGPPAWDWSPNRPITQVTLRVLADRWGVQIGAVVIIATGSPADGRYLVAETHGHMVNPETEVVLHRPAPAKLEPAPTTRTVSGTSVDAGGGGSSSLLGFCRTIDAENRPYVYGGGHGKPLGQITAHEGLDCSSSVSLALWKANMFHGQVALVSSQFAASWGAAGKGREFTVWANSEHVWIEFYKAGGVNRFDTSPHGDGPSGPHLRSHPRDDQSRFTPRRWPGH